MPLAANMLKSLPGALGVCLAPLLFGTVSQDGKAVVGCLFALGLLLQGRELGSHSRPVFDSVLGWGFLGFLILQFIPIPPVWIEFLSPEKHLWDNRISLKVLGKEDWSFLTLSRSRFINRSFDLALGIAAFQLVRESSKDPVFPVLFLRLLAVSAALLGVGAWLARVGGAELLGAWTSRLTRHGGFFENRNLFANWVYVAAILCLGLVIRSFRPIRTRRSPGETTVRPEPFSGLLILILLGTGATMAYLGGSRGGLLVFALGIAIFAVILAVKTRDQKRWAGLFALLCASLFMFSFFGEFAFSRLSQLKRDISDPSHYGKLHIWEDAIRMSGHFPWIGTGLGTFVTGHRLYKSMPADLVATHAENDYLQLLIETGIPGLALGCLFLGAGIIRIGRRVFAGRHSEPEILYGGCVAVCVFLVHASFEFVAQIPATLILVCAIFGLVAGLLDADTRPELPPPLSWFRAAVNCLLGVSLGAASVLNGLSFWRHQTGLAFWEQGDSRRAVAELSGAVRLWPWSTEKQLAVARAQIMSMGSLTLLEQRGEIVPLMKSYEKSLQYDPLNWELRLEHAWMSLIFDGPTRRSIGLAKAACKVNPKQPKIPLGFARHLKPIAPDEALEFLKLVPFGSATQECLNLAVEMDLDPAILWTLVPATTEGLFLLGEVGFSRGLNELGTQAFKKLGERLPRSELCKRFLAVRQPSFVIPLLHSAQRTTEESILLAKAYLDLSEFAASLEVSRPVWAGADASQDASITARTWEDALARDRSLSKKDRENSERLGAGIRFAEGLSVGGVSNDEVDQLRRYASEFPSVESILRVLFDVELRLGNIHSAAKASLRLAEIKLDGFGIKL